MSPLSSSLFYDRTSARMSSLTAQAQTLQDQISTGKKLSAPSDDVVAYQQLRTIATAGADGTADKANMDVAQARITGADTALTAITSQLQRASELAIQARNGTLNDSDRANIASQLSSISGTIADLANGVDASGQPLFGGSDTGAAVVANADGTHKLATSKTPSVPIGAGQSVVPGENATTVLGLSGGRNTIDMIAALATALKAGGDTSATLGSAITDLSTATTQVSDVQASLGARGARLDLVSAQATTASTQRETRRSALEDTDVTQAITDLQRTMTVLQATQASFTKLSSLSLFDYLK